MTCACEEMRECIAGLVAVFVPSDPAQAAALEKARSFLSTPEERGERPLFPR